MTPEGAQLRVDPLDPYRAALMSIRYFEADDPGLTPDYLRKILLELGFGHPVEQVPDGT